MKKILLTTAIIGLALSLNAQEAASVCKDKKSGDAARIELRKAEHHHGRHGKQEMRKHHPMDAQTMAVKKALRLKFDEVYKLYYDSFKEFEKKMSEKKADPAEPRDEASKEARRAEREAAHAAQVASLEKPMKKVLSDEQFTRWKELESNRPRPDSAKQKSDRPS